MKYESHCRGNGMEAESAFWRRMVTHWEYVLSALMIGTAMYAGNTKPVKHVFSPVFVDPAARPQYCAKQHTQ